MAPLSYWHDSLEPRDDLTPRAALPGDRDADVAIVGAGFTGLWTAYYLLRTDPSLRVVVLERDTAGFGASGRNGGWCVGDQAAPLPALEKAHGYDATHAMVAAVQAAVDEVGKVAANEGIDCGYAKGGALYLASNSTQLRRLEERRELNARYGHGDDYDMLGESETKAIVNSRRAIGGLFMHPAAALHPARLARGLARTVERLGGVVYEQTAVRAIEPGRAVTTHGVVKAAAIVRATEGYTASIRGQRRELLPVGNYMIATEPLSAETSSEIGAARREVFEDTTTLLAYAQRTADNRIAVGGLSAPSWFGGRVPKSPMTDERVAQRLRALLVDRFPVLRDVKVTHHWGGVLGLSRDFRPTVNFDLATGLGVAGGYMGSGVASSNVAGRTMADLITRTPSEYARLPWVNHDWRRWEPEPLRWLGVHAVTTMAKLADRREERRS